MTLRRSIDAVRQVVPFAEGTAPTSNTVLAGPDGQRWVAVQHQGGAVVFLPELDPVDGPLAEGLAGFLATAFDDGREPR